MKISYLYPCLLLLFAGALLKAEAQSKTDSLFQELSKASDTAKVNILYELARVHLMQDPDTAIHYGLAALEEALEEKFTKGQAKAYLVTADGYYFKKDFSTSISYLEKAAESFSTMGDLKNEADVLNKIGINYNRLGKYAEGKKYSLQALTIHTSINNPEGQWMSISNLGIIAKQVGDLKKSLEYNLEALRITQQLNDITGMSKALTNIGNTYFSLEEVDNALDYFIQAYAIADSLNNKQSMALLNNNIATCYQLKNDWERADEFYKKSLKIKKELNDHAGIAVTYNNIGFNHINYSNYEKAEASFMAALEQPSITGLTRSYSYAGLTEVALARDENDKALRFAQLNQEVSSQSNNLEQLRNSADILYKVYEKRNDYKNALHYLLLYNSYSDSLINHEKLKEIGALEARHEYQIREQQMKSQQLEARLKTEIIQTRQKYIIYLLIAGFMAMLIISFFIYRKSEQKKKANKNLQKKNVEIEQKKFEIENQKKELSELNGLKDRLFMIIAHDLKSPLQSLQMLLELTLKNVINEDDYKRHIPTLATNVGYTSNLLNNLLHWTQSQMKGEAVNAVDFDLATVVEKIIVLYDKPATIKGIRIFNHIKESVMVHADCNMIEIIIRNLVGNAIKFSDRNDTITVSAEIINGEYVEMNIVDTGTGITEENLKKILQNNQFSTPGTLNEKGTGLGLQLFKNYVNKNGGTISIESTPGEGSTFGFTLPLAASVECAG